MARGFAGADAVVAPSKWMLQQLRRHYGVRSGQVILNGREPNPNGFASKSALIFAAGRIWDAAKNLMVLDEVAKGLAWPIYLAGESRDPVKQTLLAARHLQLLGKLSGTDVTAWLSQASIYAFPALYEPFGLSVLEAALAGCALVLGDIPTLREQWDGRAVFVRPDDPDTLRLALNWLIEDRDLRNALAMRAQRHALTLTARRMALGYLGLYSELLTRPKRSSEVPACAL
jgi:glycosyltransferase involved in cell wall biosynthesis